MHIPQPSIQQQLKRCSVMEWIAFALWSIVLAVILLRAAIAPEKHTVLPIYTRAASHWLQGAELYAGQIDFRYSPPIAALFVPFEILPERIAALLWRILTASVFLFSFSFLLQSLLPKKLPRDSKAILYLLILPLAAAAIDNGQVNPILCALIVASICALYRSSWTFACLFIILAAAFKVYPAALGILFMLLYPRQITLRLLLLTALLLALSLFLREPAYVIARYQEWFHALTTDNRDLWTIARAPEDARLLLRLTFGMPSPLFYKSLQAATALLIAALCFLAHRLRMPMKELLLLILSLTTSWMLLFGPATEANTFVLLSPALAITLILRPRTPNAQAPWILAIAAYLLLAASQFAGWSPKGVDLQSLGIAPFGVLLFLIGVTLQAFTRLKTLNNDLHPEPLIAQPTPI